MRKKGIRRNGVKSAGVVKHRKNRSRRKWCTMINSHNKSFKNNEDGN